MALDCIDHLPASLTIQLLLSLVLCVALSLLSIDVVEALGLNLAVDKGTDHAGEDLLGLGVRRGLTCVCVVSDCTDSSSRSLTISRDVVLVGLGGFVSGSTAKKLVRPLGLVRTVGNLIVGASLIGVVYDSLGKLYERGKRDFWQDVAHRRTSPL